MGTLTKEGREARREYMKQYLANQTPEQREKRREYCRAYQKKWREENPDKVKEIRIRYWNRKGQTAEE